MRILLVEDDEMISASLQRGLRDSGYAVDCVGDGVAALAALKDIAADHSLVLLDWNLPRRDGLAVLRQLRTDGRAIPVLMLTARDAPEDVVAGLDAGADDYLSKPFELGVLCARIRVLLRRREGRTTNVMLFGSLTVDEACQEVTVAGTPVRLSSREFSLLRVLLEQPGALRSRRQLEERLYGWEDGVESNALEVLIHALRRKLGSGFIENVRGVGWRLRDTS